MVKCANCGKELPKKQNICPACGKDNTLVQQLRDAKIPKELKHLPLQKIGHRIEKLRAIHEKKKWILASLGVLVIGLIVGVFYFKGQSDPGDVHNFHDDLIEITNANANGNTVTNWANDAYVVPYGSSLYAVSGDDFYCIPMTLETKRVTTHQKGSNLNIIQDTLYFINQDHDNVIEMVDLKTKTTTETKYKANKMIVVGNYIYYTGKDDHSAIHQMRTDFTENKTLTQSGCITFTVTGDWLYYSTNDGIYRVPILGGEVAKVVDGYYRYFMIQDEYIYYRGADEAVYRMMLDGSDKTKVVNEQVNSFALNNHYLFYATKEGGIFKLDMENANVTQLSVDKAKDLQLSKTWVYYRLVENNEGCFVSMDENSNKVIPIYSIKDVK